MFNIRILIEKHLQHQRDLFHNFIYFKKAFDRVWHDGLWQVMRNYNIDSNIIDVIKALCDDSKSAVLQSDKTRLGRNTDNATVETDNGTAETDNGTAETDNGTTETDNGTTETDNGTAETDNATVETQTMAQ
ncbi:hypothetical protein ACOMHN_004598 [Nucella lapillus]